MRVLSGLLVNDKESEHRGYGLLVRDQERERRRLNAFYGGFAGVGYGFGTFYTPGPNMSARCTTDPNDGDWALCPPGWDSGTPQRACPADGPCVMITPTIDQSVNAAQEKMNLQIVQGCQSQGLSVNYGPTGIPSCGGSTQIQAAPPPRMSTNPLTGGVIGAGLTAINSGGGSTIGSMINSLITGATGGGQPVPVSNSKADVEYALAALAVIAAGVVGYKMWKKRRSPATSSGNTVRTMAGYRRRKRSRR